MQKIQDIDKKIPVTTRITGHILDGQVSNSGVFSGFFKCEQFVDDPEKPLMFPINDINANFKLFLPFKAAVHIAIPLNAAARSLPSISSMNYITKDILMQAGAIKILGVYGFFAILS